jgi:cyanate permease
MVLWGLALCAAASLFAAWGPQGWLPLLTSRAVEGMGFMTVAVACPALITAASSPRRQRFALGLWSAYMPAGAAIAMAFAPSLLPRTGWHGLWAATAILLLLAALLLWMQRARFPVPAAASGNFTPAVSFLAPVRQALGQPLPWLLALSFGVWATQHFALIVWMPTYMLDKRGMGAGSVALLTSIMLVACVPGNLIGGALVQRGLPRGALLAMAQLLTGLGAVAYTTESLADPLRYAAAVFVSFIGGLIPAAVMASSTVLARTPQQIGTLQGLFMQGAQLGQFIGTPLIAAVVAASGQWRSSLWVTGSAALVGVVLGSLAQRLEARIVPAVAARA